MRGGKSATGLALAVAVSMATVSAVATAAGSGARPPTLEFLGQSIFPTGTDFEGTQVGGLSSITFDERRGVFYAISDDQSQFAPARYYTLRVDLDDGRLDDGDVEFLDVTTLLAPDGQPYPLSGLDPEGLTLTKSGELIVTSEGIPGRGIAPWVRRYGLDGTFLGDLPVPTCVHRPRPHPWRPSEPGVRVRSRGARRPAPVRGDGGRPAAGRTGCEPHRRQPSTDSAIQPHHEAAGEAVRLPDRPCGGAAGAAQPVLRERSRRAAAVQQRVHALDGALVLGGRTWNGQHDQALLGLVPPCVERRRRRQRRQPARRHPTRRKVTPSSTCVRWASRSTTSRAWPSARTCPTADAP